MRSLKISGILGLCILSMASSCVRPPDADDMQSQATEVLVGQANAEVGMPDIVNFTERRIFKDILELRDEPNLRTYTYIVDMTGRLLPLCESIGYGLPYSVQYTNPQRVSERRTNYSTLLPQPDPNGLFMPSGLSATWVLCIDPTTGEPDPLYVEPEIIVSRFELEFNGWGNPGN